MNPFEAPRTPRLISKLNAGEKQTIVTYGTSLTEGGQWVNDLRDWLDTQYPGIATVLNGGLSGKASNTALKRLDERVLVHRPDLVFLEFAVNDAALFEPGDPDYDISPELCEANLNQLIDRIQAANPDAEIILQTMNPAWDAPNGNRSGSRRPQLPEYYEVYRRTAAARNLPLIDHHANWVSLQTANPDTFHRYIEDGVHPTTEGSTAITFPAVLDSLMKR